MDKDQRLVVLVTGGSGFLGQHIIQHLQDCSNIKEIRVLDIKPFTKNIDNAQVKLVKTVLSDITDLNEEGKQLFIGVHCVFHCAAFVSYEFPPDTEKLYKVNVDGTRKVIKECIDNNIAHLIFTSGTEVCLKPYFKNGYFSVIINQTESKLQPPRDSSELVFGPFAVSKLEAEKLVLVANNTALRNGVGKLKSISLRPTLLYGEGDTQFIPSVNRISTYNNGILWSLLGPGGKQQITYAGNAAWAHICAMNTLIEGDTDNIGGKAMFITDDTPIYDLARVSHYLIVPKTSTESTQSETAKPRKFLCLPAFLTFIAASLFELVYSNISNKLFMNYRLPISPKLCITYSTSVLFFNRLRANLGVNYIPLYSPEVSMERSSKYYKQNNFYHK